MNDLLHAIMNDSAFFAITQLTVILGIAILSTALFQKSAITRHSILFAALICMFAGPGILVSTCLTGYTICIPVLTSEPSKPLVAQPQLGAKNNSGSIWSEPTLIQPKRQKSISQGPSVNVAKTTLPPLKAKSSPSPAYSSATSSSLPASKWNISWRFIGLAAWVAGAVFYLFGVALAMYRLRRLLRTVTPIDAQEFSHAIARATSNLSIAEYPRVGVTCHIKTPMAVGTGRSAWVLLPAKCLKTATSDQLAHILTHEGAHVVRNDAIVQLVQRINLALWWWHPLVHLVCQQLHQAREEICDNFVLKTTEAYVYGETLLELGKTGSPLRPPVLANTLFGASWKLETRISGILSRKEKL